MTGYGKAEFEVNGKKVTLEIKSLNSKQLDINTRIPALYREKDIEIRKLVSEFLTRGKVDLVFYIESLGEETNSAVNENVVKGYFEQIKKVNTELGLPVSELTMQSILRFPDAIKLTFEQLDETEWQVIRQKMVHALESVNAFRVQEGNAMEADLRSNIESILELLKKVEPFEAQRIETVKVRLKDSLAELQLNGSFDKNRFEQELIYYLEKLDINEEKVRLRNHCEYFLHTLHDDSTDSGKKLGFIAQEIGREINTLGSKANETSIQKIVVQMKDSLERVKEQVLNVL